MRSASSFPRNKPRYAPQPRVLIICEDLKSGKSYLDDASRALRANAEVRVVHKGKTDPLGIVNAAIEEAKNYEKVYCVIDRDQHENFDQAINKAEGLRKVQVIDSHPCFEYWILLHYKYSTKQYRSNGKLSSGELLIKDLRNHPGMANYEKGSAANLFMKLFGKPLDNARKNAAKSLQHATETNDLNPSTKLHILIEEIEKLGRPQLAT